MLVDYLRYVAFAGGLRQFFANGIANEFVEPTILTGQHLRFSKEFIEQQFRSGLRNVNLAVIRAFLGEQWESWECERFRHLLGVAESDWVSSAWNGYAPVRKYENSEPQVEIILDVDPAGWSSRFLERSRFEQFPVLFRQSGPATGNIASGDKLFKATDLRNGAGTLCGAFSSVCGTYALTCGHVIDSDCPVLVEKPRKFWFWPLGPNLVSLGKLHPTRADLPSSIGNLVLDAALIEVNQTAAHDFRRSARVQPISTLMQEARVYFQGAGTNRKKNAKILAVTVSKKMDLRRNGVLQDVGDVLMLGHADPIYFCETVSRPGDSGAAVRSTGDDSLWQGMVLGSDQGGAYATYSEHLCMWASQVLASPIDFRF